MPAGVLSAIYSDKKMFLKIYFNFSPGQAKAQKNSPQRFMLKF